MAFLNQDRLPYIFHIRYPRYLSALGLYLLVVFVAPSVYIGSKIGVGWIPSNLLPALFLIATMGGGILFALWILFPPKSTLARIEFTSDRVRFVPNLIARSIGEQSEETVISPQSTETSSAIASCRKRSMAIASLCAQPTAPNVNSQAIPRILKLISKSPRSTPWPRESLQSQASPSAWSFGGNRPPEPSKRRPGRRPPQKESC